MVREQHKRVAAFQSP